MKKDLSLPLDANRANQILEEYGSPLHIYDEVTLRKQAKGLTHSFAWAREYKNYFAVKATPTPAILKILLEEGMGLDCSSRTELLMAQRLNVSGENIFFTSNNTPQEDFELAIELGATVNLDDLSQVSVFTSALGNRPLSRVAARYNPGNLKSGNDIIGEPIEAKYGMNLESLVEAFTQLKDLDIKEFGLHTMVASNELKPSYFAETAEILLQAAAEIEDKTGIKFTFINLGGGFGLNYQPNQKPLDIDEAANQIRQVVESRSKSIKVFTENGRYVTGGAGFLLTRVRYVMNKYKTYVGVDASMHNLMRPGMYGAYHHITVLGKDNDQISKQYDVVGSLCENNDKFAIDRSLPQVEAGDVLVIHDTGAHGHAMGFNYNGLLRSAEVLLTESGETKLIRKAETEEDYFRNIVW